jgi:hypothetical protein
MESGTVYPYRTLKLTEGHVSFSVRVGLHLCRVP